MSGCLRFQQRQNGSRELLSFWTIVIMTFLALVASQPDDPLKDGNIAVRSVEPYSTLYHLIEKKQWLEAQKQLQQAPDEAFVLIEKRNDAGKIITRHLPLHEAFSVDLPKHEGIQTELNQEEMSKGQIELVLALLHTNPHASALQDMQMRLPLHVALYSTNPPPLSIIDALLKANPHAVQEKDSQDRLALHAATTTPLSSLDIIEALVQANPNAVRNPDQDGSLPIHLAVWGGDVPHAMPVIQYLIQQGPETLSVPDEDDETPLVIMAKYGRTSPDAVRYAVDLDKSGALEYRDETEGNTLLHYAVSPSIVNNTIYTAFLDGLPEAAKLINRVGQLPIHTALSTCCTSKEIVSSLLQAYPKSAHVRDGFGYLPIHYACQGGDLNGEIVDLLLESNPQGAKQPTSDGFLPLHLVMASFDFSNDATISSAAHVEEIIIKLLKAFPDAANIKDPETNQLPLHNAITVSAPFRVQSLLVKLNPKAICPVDETTLSSIHALVENGPLFLTAVDMKKLLNESLKLDPTCSSKISNDGDLPLHIVWKSAINETTFSLASRRVVFDTLFEANQGAVRGLGKDGKTPLSLACLAHDAYAVEKILQSDPFVAQIESDSGSLPLHDACTTNGLYPFPHTGENNHKIVSQLLNIYPGAASVVDKEGELAIHRISKSAGTDHFWGATVEMLIESHQEALQAKNNAGDLPLHKAVQEVRDCTNMMECEYQVETVRLLLNSYPEASAVPNSRGSTALAIVMEDPQTLSSFRKDKRDPLLRSLQLLYQHHPDAILEQDGRGWSTLHRVAVLVGDLGGSISTEWADLIVSMIQDFPQLLSVGDVDSRTPLHLLLLNLGDTAMGARRNDQVSYTYSQDLERILYTALAMGDESILQTKEKYGLTPLDLITHERLKAQVGPLSYSESPIIQMSVKMLKRGEMFWKVAGDVMILSRKSSCGAVNEQSLVAYLEELLAEALGHNFSGDKRTAKNTTQQCTENDSSRKEESNNRCIDLSDRIQKLSDALLILAKAIDDGQKGFGNIDNRNS